MYKTSNQNQRIRELKTIYKMNKPLHIEALNQFRKQAPLVSSFQQLENQSSPEEMHCVQRCIQNKFHMMVPTINNFLGLLNRIFNKKREANYKHRNDIHNDNHQVVNEFIVR